MRDEGEEMKCEEGGNSNDRGGRRDEGGWMRDECLGYARK